MMKRIVATNRIMEMTEENVRFKEVVDQSIEKFKLDEWSETPSDDVYRNLSAQIRGSGLILGCYKTIEGFIHVFMDGKQDKITVCFGNEIL